MTDIDLSSNPKRMTFVFLGKPETRCRAIYSLKGDLWTICYSMTEVPKAFDTSSGDGRYLLELKRGLRQK